MTSASDSNFIAEVLCNHYSAHKIVGRGVTLEHRYESEPFPCESCQVAGRKVIKALADRDANWVAALRVFADDKSPTPDYVHPDSNRECLQDPDGHWYYVGRIKCYREHDEIGEAHE